jgi:hypothetical protein
MTILLVVMFVSSFYLIAATEKKLSFPTDSWDETTYIAQHIDGGKFAIFKNTLNNKTSFVVTRFGKVVDWLNWDGRVDISSAFKPFITHFLFKYETEHNSSILDQRLENLPNSPGSFREKLGQMISGHGSENKYAKNYKITWRHLANQTSNYGVAEDPGAAFSYNDYQTALFFDFLFKDLWGIAAGNEDNFLHSELTDVIECEDNPTFYGINNTYAKGRMKISARDFARFGLLYLNGGKWGNEMIIDSGLVEQVTSEVLPLSLQRSQYYSDLDELSEKFESLPLVTSPPVTLPHFSTYTDPGHGENGVMTDIENYNSYLSVPLTTKEMIAWDEKINIPVIDLNRSVGDKKLKARDQDWHFGSYGWTWWKNGKIDAQENLFWVIDATNPTNNQYAKGIYAAIGKDGRDVLLVLPRLNMVVTWTGVTNFPPNTEGSRDTRQISIPINALLNSVQHNWNGILTVLNNGASIHQRSSFDIEWDATDFNLRENVNLFLYQGNTKLGKINSGTIIAGWQNYCWQEVGKYFTVDGIEHLSSR